MRKILRRDVNSKYTEGARLPIRAPAPHRAFAKPLILEFGSGKLVRRNLLRGEYPPRPRGPLGFQGSRGAAGEGNTERPGGYRIIRDFTRESPPALMDTGNLW